MWIARTAGTAPSLSRKKAGHTLMRACATMSSVYMKISIPELCKKNILFVCLLKHRLAKMLKCGPPPTQQEMDASKEKLRQIMGGRSPPKTPEHIKKQREVNAQKTDEERARESEISMKEYKDVCHQKIWQYLCDQGLVDEEYVFKYI